jgi:hypothetical protein
VPISPSPAADLVSAAHHFLEEQVLPSLSGENWFNLRITINMLAMVGRELRLADNADAEALQRLKLITGVDGTLEELNRTLSLMIRAGKISIEDGGLLDHLRRTTADALKINNPQWLTR